MKKYRWAVTLKGPHTWHACGPVEESHALNQYRAFGIVYQLNSRWLLDYEKLNQEVKEKPKGNKKELVSGASLGKSEGVL